MVVKVPVAHGFLHLANFIGGVPVGDHFGVFDIRNIPLDAKILASVKGDGFTQLLELRADEGLLYQVVGRMLASLHAGFDDLLHGCTDDFLGDLVVFVERSPRAFSPSPKLPVIPSCLATRCAAGFSVSG